MCHKMTALGEEFTVLSEGAGARCTGEVKAKAIDMAHLCAYSSVCALPPTGHGKFTLPTSLQVHHSLIMWAFPPTCKAHLSLIK